MKLKRVRGGAVGLVVSLILGLPLSLHGNLEESAVSVPQVSSTETAPALLPSLKIEINIPARELTLFDNGQVIAHYPVAIGQTAYPSIVMSDEATKIEWNPWWYPPDSPWAAGASVTPPGPGNPLGLVKIPLGQGIRIHGTNKEKSVGHAASHGCFRMFNKDAKELAWYLQSHLSDKTDPALLKTYEKNRRTTYVVPLIQPAAVEIIYEPIVLRGDQVYFYSDVYGKVKNWYDRLVSVLDGKNIDSNRVNKEYVENLKKQLRKGSFLVPLNELVADSKTASLTPSVNP